MKIRPEVENQLARIDDNINNTQAAITNTESAINQLTRLNESRRHYLRELGRKRAELTTFELELG